MYRCPKCGSQNLEVIVQVWATLIQTDDGFQTDTTTPDNSSHDWSDESLMRCTDCGADEQIADAFKVPEAA
jgi:DNA-directed RNA polymerase subunit RPC12/RpoP